MGLDLSDTPHQTTQDSVHRGPRHQSWAGTLVSDTRDEGRTVPVTRETALHITVKHCLVPTS